MRVSHVSRKQYPSRQEAGGGRPVVHVATCGCRSSRFFNSQSNLLPAEWPALHPLLVWKLRQVHILGENRLKSLFMLSFYSRDDWTALYATHQDVFSRLLENLVADLWSSSHGNVKTFFIRKWWIQVRDIALFRKQVNKSGMLLLDDTVLLGGAFGNEIVWKRWILKQTLQPFYFWDDCYI